MKFKQILLHNNNNNNKKKTLILSAYIYVCYLMFGEGL